MSLSLAIGIDIGGTFTKVGVVDREGNLYGEDDFVTPGYKDLNEYLDTVKKHIDELLANIKADYSIKGIGIGAPNANYFRGTIEHAANLEWKGIVPFSDKLSERYNYPIVITNDASAAAVGEMIFGAAKNMKDFMVITLGTGLGSGIVANGKLIYGHDAQAGELGHVNVENEGRICGCGHQGCLETYVSSTGIKRNVFYLMAHYMEDSELRNYTYHELTGEAITKAAKKGDKIALEAFEMTGRILGKKLADFVAFSHPEVIFLLGGLAKAGNLIFEPTRKHLEQNLLTFYKGKVKLEPSGLMETNAAILGAAALVWEHGE